MKVQLSMFGDVPGYPIEAEGSAFFPLQMWDELSQVCMVQLVFIHLEI